MLDVAEQEFEHKQIWLWSSTHHCCTILLPSMQKGSKGEDTAASLSTLTFPRGSLPGLCLQGRHPPGKQLAGQLVWPGTPPRGCRQDEASGPLALGSSERPPCRVCSQLPDSEAAGLLVC